MVRDILNFYAGYNNATEPHFQAREKKVPMQTNDNYAKAYNLYLQTKFQDLEKLSQTSNDEYAAYFTAMHYWHLQKYGEALKLLEPHPGNFEVSVLRIFILIAMNCYQEVKKHLKEMVVKFSDHDVIIQYCEALAQLYLSDNQEEIQNAFFTFQEIAQSYGQNDHLSNLLSVTSLRLNNIQDAMQWNSKVQGFKANENTLNAMNFLPHKSKMDDVFTRAISSYSVPAFK
eukprot:NODE_847_length_3554_cov_0.525036.p2 type:complete len:229 gc:universal NODE_847_length_3554_cov_0.525036:1521-835(-)